MSPLAIDLFCGLGGWSEGLISAGWECIGFDIERHDYGSGGYPGQLVLQDVLTLHGSQFRNAHLIVASPPCQGYSYRAMPWSRAKALPPPDNSLFDACFRIQQEACEAAGRYIPMVVENVRGAQKWTRRADWRFGSYYLWGDVPALMPLPFRAQKNTGGSWFSFRDGKHIQRNDPRDVRRNSNGEYGLKRPGRTISAGFNNWPKDENGAYVMPDGSTVGGRSEEGIKFGVGWRHDSTNNLIRKASSRSHAHKAASAQIAKIPFALSSHIGRVYHP